MRTLQIILLISAGLLSTACGKQDADAAKKTAPAAAVPATAAKSAAPMSEPTPSTPMPASDGATRYIDHTKDEIEFGYRKSLAGLESLLEDDVDSDQISMIKKNIAELQSKLDDL